MGSCSIVKGRIKSGWGSGTGEGVGVAMFVAVPVELFGNVRVGAALKVREAVSSDAMADVSIDVLTI